MLSHCALAHKCGIIQVKELGIYMKNCPTVAKIVEGYFENLWTLSSLNASQYIKQVWDEQFQLSRPVPCWSQFLSPESRCKYEPLPSCFFWIYQIPLKFWIFTRIHLRIKKLPEHSYIVQFCRTTEWYCGIF